MTWYWYSSLDTEIFIDCDQYEQSIKHMRMRLQGAIENRKLYIKKLYQFNTSENKCHVVIVLITPMHVQMRALWAMILHSDIYRAASTLSRIHFEVPNPDILIARRIYHRQPNAICSCDIPKHKLKHMENCPAAIQLRGDWRQTTFFGKPSRKECILL